MLPWPSRRPRVPRLLAQPVSEAVSLSAPLNPAVTLNKVTKLFGRFAALREVSAVFCPERLYAVLGENGAGKTTLLRVVAGLTKPTKGDVSVPSTHAVLNRRTIGYMAHASLLYDELSGLENLRYFAGLYGIRSARHCQELMCRVGLDPNLTRRVGDYSQGMKQRLSLARAIIHDPSVLLFDEPFSNLDAASAREIAGLLAGMRSSGKCVLVVTHQAGLLKDVADESLLLTQGQLTARAQGVAAEWSMDNFQKGSA